MALMLSAQGRWVQAPRRFASSRSLRGAFRGGSASYLEQHSDTPSYAGSSEVPAPESRPASRFVEVLDESEEGDYEPLERSSSEEGTKHTSIDEGPPGLPRPVGFWDPRLKYVRREAMLKWLVTTTILMTFILAVLSIYWGVFTEVEKNLSSLRVLIVDFDAQVLPFSNMGITPVVGPIITQLGMDTINSGMPHLGFNNRPPSDYGYDPMEVRRAVYDFEAWAAFIINPNATAMLQSAVQNGNSSYDPMGACQLVFVSSRDDTNWSDLIFPKIAEFVTEATARVGQQWAAQVLQNAQNDQTVLDNLANAPQALSPAIGFSQYDLRPFLPYTAIPAVSIGLIYLIIVAFFSFTFYLPIHFRYLRPEGHPVLKFSHLVIWRWCSTVSAYFFLSLAYSLVSLAFQINFSGGNPVRTHTVSTWTVNGNNNPDAYGHGTFPVYWMLNFFGMIALGLACENAAMFVGQPWTGLWLIFWVITNVSTAFYDLDVEPGFYRWGYVWPLHYIVEGSRQILFDLHPRIGVDFAVLIAWGAINTVLFPIACWFMRWKSQHHVHEYYR